LEEQTGWVSGYSRFTKTEEEAAAEHCSMDNMTITIDDMLDWMAEVLMNWRQSSSLREELLFQTNVLRRKTFLCAKRD
jgi:hypothetical protein